MLSAIQGSKLLGFEPSNFDKVRGDYLRREGYFRNQSPIVSSLL